MDDSDFPGGLCNFPHSLWSNESRSIRASLVADVVAVRSSQLFTSTLRHAWGEALGIPTLKLGRAGRHYGEPFC